MSGTLPENLDKSLISLAEKIERVIAKGDLSALSDEEKVIHYKNVCDSLGLNHLTQPFGYITLNNKLCLYALKGCTDQLRSLRKISIKITSREKVGDVYIVTAQAIDPMGRVDESTGVVAFGKLAGDALANAFMKAETKAKRRVTLSICGLGMLDETEVETIPKAKVVESSSEPARPEVGQKSLPLATEGELYRIKLPDVVWKDSYTQKFKTKTHPLTGKTLQQAWEELSHYLRDTFEFYQEHKHKENYDLPEVHEFLQKTEPFLRGKDEGGDIDL